MGKVLIACCALALVSGCASIDQAQNTCMREGLNYVYKDYVVAITSEPSGAKVDWNGEYIGDTPLQRVLNDRRGMCAPAVITVHAVSAGQKCRTKKFAGTEPLPREIHFDL